MTRKYVNLTKTVPQSEPLDGRQVMNNAGGFVYGLDDWARLDRFLVLGSDAATYYQSARALTLENAAVVATCWAADPERTASAIVQVSADGRAPKNDPAIFALAIGAAHADLKVRKLALAGLPQVCRTSTHLFQFINAARGLGKGWGRAMKTAVADWYDQKSADQLAYQMIKYRSREAMTHKRIMQTAHPAAGEDAPRLALYRWVRELDYDRAALPKLVTAHLEAMRLKAPGAERRQLIKLVKEHRLPWEAIPTEATTDADVWAAMLPEMGMTALIRNLGAMTSYGTMGWLSGSVRMVVKRLGDRDELKRARIHPFTVLQALAIYRSGAGMRGSLKWSPSSKIVEALDKAFYATFKTIKPTGKRFLIGLDVSGSMGAQMMGSPLTCREAAAAMAMVAVRTEPAHHLIGFTAGAEGVTVFPITPKMRLEDVVRMTSNLNFGTTDCALPMLYAMKNKLEVDAFVVYTDNETWAGQVHPMLALRQYRAKTGIPAKLVVVGITSTGFSIADPADGGALDVVGFDSAAPALVADFIRG